MLNIKKFFKNPTLPETTAILDIGSSKIVCVLAEINPDNSFKIIGYSHNASKGFDSSGITDLKEAISSINRTLEEVETMSGYYLENILLVISTKHIQSQILYSHCLLDNKTVSEFNIRDLLNESLRQIDITKHNIIHLFPIEYVADNINHIKDPRGLLCNKLSCKLHVITTPSSHLQNLSQCLGECQLNIDDYVTSYYASSLSCLKQDEIDMGVAFVEIGHSVTSYAIFKEGTLINTGNVKLGGKHITADISKCLSISFEEAERIKNLYGEAYNTSGAIDKQIEVKDPEQANYIHEETRTISHKLLNEIINARMEEILNNLHKDLENKIGDPSLYKRIVISGGTSQLQGLQELMSKKLNAKVRSGTPRFIEGLPLDNLTSYAACIGGIKYYINKKNSKTKHKILRQNKKNSNKLIKWIKENV
jgi:cell division protein FtsA